MKFAFVVGGMSLKPCKPFSVRGLATTGSAAAAATVTGTAQPADKYAVLKKMMKVGLSLVCL